MQVGHVQRVLHLVDLERADRMQSTVVHVEAAIAEPAEELASLGDAAIAQMLDKFDQHTRLASPDRLDRALQHGVLVTLDVDLDEADVALVDVVELVHRDLDLAPVGVERRGHGVDGRAPGDVLAVLDRHAQDCLAHAIGQGDGLDHCLPPELVGQHADERRVRLEADHPLGVRPHEVDVAAVVRSHVDGIALPVTQELEPVQLDLSVPAVVPLLFPVLHGLRQVRNDGLYDVHGFPQCLVGCFAIIRPSSRSSLPCRSKVALSPNVLVLRSMGYIAISCSPPWMALIINCSIRLGWSLIPSGYFFWTLS